MSDEPPKKAVKKLPKPPKKDKPSEAPPTSDSVFFKQFLATHRFNSEGGTISRADLLKLSAQTPLPANTTETKSVAEEMYPHLFVVTLDDLREHLPKDGACTKEVKQAWKQAAQKKDTEAREKLASDMEMMKEEAKKALAVEAVTNPVVKVIDELVLSSSTDDQPFDLVFHGTNLVYSKGSFSGFVSNLHLALPDLKEYLESKAAGKDGKKAKKALEYLQKWHDRCWEGNAPKQCDVGEIEEALKDLRLE